MPTETETLKAQNAALQQRLTAADQRIDDLEAQVGPAIPPKADEQSPRVIAYAAFANNGNIRCWSSDCTAVGLKVAEEGGSRAVELIDRAHVAPLLSEIKRLQVETAKYQGGCVDLSSQVRELEHKMDYWKTQNDTLRAQLAERDELLRNWCCADCGSDTTVPKADHPAWEGKLSAPSAKDAPVCQGCGGKGWTATCDQCIPY